MTDPRPLTEQEQAEVYRVRDIISAWRDLDWEHDRSPEYDPDKPAPLAYQKLVRARWEAAEAVYDAIEALVRRCGDAERRAVLAEAHDRQPYPTAEAYDLVCKARDKWQARAEKAEAERDEARFTAERLRNTIFTAPAFPVTQAEADSISCLPWERPDAAEGAR